MKNIICLQYVFGKNGQRVLLAFAVDVNVLPVFNYFAFLNQFRRHSVCELPGRPAFGLQQYVSASDLNDQIIHLFINCDLVDSEKYDLTRTITTHFIRRFYS